MNEIKGVNPIIYVTELFIVETNILVYAVIAAPKRQHRYSKW